MKVLKLLAPLVSVFVFSSVAFAQEAVGGAPETGEMFYNEAMGVVLAVGALLMMVSVAKKLGGDLGKAFWSYVVALLFLSGALVWRGYLEFTGVEGDAFYQEIVFEGLIYVALLIFFVGSFTLNKALKS